MVRASKPSDLRPLDTLIRRGESAEAAVRVEALAAVAITRAERLGLASLSHRCGLAALGLRLLAPQVRPTQPQPAAASDREKAVYAACLLRVGAVEEAVRLLGEVREEQEPLGIFLRAAAAMSRWRYDEAAPLLARYARHPRVTGYERLVAQVNLAAAWHFQRNYRNVLPLLRSLLHATSLRHLTLLRGNVLELAAQVHVTRRKWDDAARFLDLAEQQLGRVGTRDLFFVGKWRRIIEYLRGGSDDLSALRALAGEHRHWETLRECDRFEAVRRRDEAQFLRVYFGTPHAAYRASLRRDFPGEVSLPAVYEWRSDEGPGKRRLDLTAGRRAGALEVPRLSHRFLALLASDHYAPFRTAEIAHRLYPEECFDPESSPERVYELMRRTRRWIGAERLPLKIVAREGAFRLELTAPFTLRLDAEAPDSGVLAPLEKRLGVAFGAAEFRSAEASERLEIPLRSLQRELDRLVSDRRLERAGKGKATRYRRREQA